MPLKTAPTVREATPLEMADVAVRRVLAGLKENRPEVLWDALPASYQRDLNETLHEAVRRVPADVWQASQQAIPKFVRLARAFLSDSSGGSLKLNGEDLQGDSQEVAVCLVEGAFDVMDAWAGDDLPTQSQLAESRVGDLWRRIGPTILQVIRNAQDRLASNAEPRLFSALFELRVVLERESSGIAVVSFQPQDAAVDPVEIEFVSVEGKWIPRTLAAKWREAIDTWKKSIRDKR
ncbi:MAG: hypothetical protein ACKV0T_23170 [Planctomycetales bacterium]